MADHQNFQNGNQTFNIHLEGDGDLYFKANGQDGDGDTVMVIADTSGEVTIGGPFGRPPGRLLLKDGWDRVVALLGKMEAEGETSLALGGLSSSGRVRLTDSSGRDVVDLNGQSGELTLGAEGGGINGNVYILNSDGTKTMELTEGHLHLYNDDGEVGVDLHVNSAHLHLFGAAGGARIDVMGDESRLELFDSDAVKRVSLDGETGNIQLLNGNGVVTADLRGGNGRLTLGANDSDGDLAILDENGEKAFEVNGATSHVQLWSGNVSRAELAGSTGTLTLLNSEGTPNIVCESSGGRITCGEVTETSDGRLKEHVSPLTNALENVMSLQGVRYRSAPGTASAGDMVSDSERIGFIGQEVEEVCPELVVTGAGGYKSVNYSRMTAVLVEAVKEQQQLILRQAAALEAVSERLEHLLAADRGAIGRT